MGETLYKMERNSHTQGLLDADSSRSIFTLISHFKDTRTGDSKRRRLGWLKPEEQDEGRLKHICKFKVKIKSLRKRNTFFFL